MSDKMDSDKKSSFDNEPPRFGVSSMPRAPDDMVLAGEVDLAHLFKTQRKDIKEAMNEVLDSRSTSQTSPTKERASFMSHLFKPLGRHAHPKDSDLEATQRHEKLQQENEKLQAEKQEAEKEIEALRQTNQRLQEDNRAARKEITRLGSQVKTTNDRNVELREMLTRPTEQQVYDSELVHKFASLRHDIIALVRQTWNLAVKDSVDFTQMSEDQQETFKPNEPYTYDRLRSVVFEIICTNIFESRPYFLDSEWKELEEKIAMVEETIQKNKTSEIQNDLIEWRIASLKITESFRDDERGLSRTVQQKILGFLGVMRTKSQDAEQEGKRRLEAICDDAVALSLAIRQLKDNFWVDRMCRAVGKPISEWDDLAEEMTEVTVANGKQPGTIAYVIAGALIKNPKENPEKVLVLEKAEVAVYR